MIAAAATVAIAPVGSVTAEHSAASAAHRPVQLTAEGDSILNIPLNLFQQLVNIPNTEVEALDTLAKSLLFTGTWFTASATNIWGEDPGDPGHFMAIIDLLIPFKAISGLGTPEIDPEAAAAGTAGLGQQLALLAAAEIPADATCNADWCAPLHPTTPITGSSLIDWTIWALAILTGKQHFPLTDPWFKLPLSELTSGYTFGTVVSPSSGVGPGGSVPGDEVFGFPGTHLGPNGENLMPWSNLTFTLNLAAPFQNFFNSLLAPVDLAGFEFPGIEETARALQSVAAGLVVDLYPFVPGGPNCPGYCELPDFLTMEGIVKTIGASWPGNPLIDHWLELTANGLANAPTQEQVDFAVEFLQGLQGVFDFGNPLPSDPPPSVENPAPFDVDPFVGGIIQAMNGSWVQGFFQTLADLAGFEPAFPPAV